MESAIRSFSVNEEFELLKDNLNKVTSVLAAHQIALWEYDMPVMDGISENPFCAATICSLACCSIGINSCLTQIIDCHMKKIVLIGASGFVGSAILNEALNRDFHVKAVARHPEKIKIISENLVLKKADVSSLDEVCEVCKGADAIISAYNPGWNNPNIYNETIGVYLTILNGVKKAGVNRFLMVGGAGSLFIAPELRLMDSGEVPEAILPAVKALGKFYLDFLKKEKEVDWVFFSPAADMATGVRTGRYRLGKGDMIVDAVGNSHISVEDYAAAMIDELERPAHHQERFTIGY